MSYLSLVRNVKRSAIAKGMHLEYMGGGYYALCHGTKPTDDEESQPSPVAAWCTPAQISLTLDKLQEAKRFQVGDETFTGKQMVIANGDDAEVLAWLDSAKVGESFTTFHGELCERIA